MFIWVIFLFSTIRLIGQIRLIGLIRHKVTENLVAILTNKVLITADTACCVPTFLVTISYCIIPEKKLTQQ